MAFESSLLGIPEDFQISMDRDNLFSNFAKIIVVGEPFVGKSSIILSYIENQFKYNLQATCGVDYNAKTILLDERNQLKIQIWDTAGQEKYRSLIANYYKNAHGALLVFDLTSKKSFEAVKTCWLESLKKLAPPQVCKVLLANKCDITQEVEVSDDEIKQFEKEYKIMCIKTSAKEKIGIDEAFLFLAKLMNETFLFITSTEITQELLEQTMKQSIRNHQNSISLRISMCKTLKAGSGKRKLLLGF